MRNLTFCVFLSAVSVAALAQAKEQPKKQPETISGCVTPSAQDKGKLVLKSKDSCSELAGKAAQAARLSGHVVALDGTLALATPDEPETLTITSVKEVGASCSETCTLEPPGSRALKRKKGETMGKVGGTPGAQPDKPSTEPPQR